MFLKQGKIVSVVDRAGRKENYKADQQDLTNKPLAVLVNQGSASASEILSGALQDNKRAVLVGTRTFGKGVVQSVQSLESGSALKVTIAHYYTPTGKDINHLGITPNVVVKLPKDQEEALVSHDALGTLSDPQFKAALSNLTHQIQARSKL